MPKWDLFAALNFTMPFNVAGYYGMGPHTASASHNLAWVSQ
jgi:hypothetical protein